MCQLVPMLERDSAKSLPTLGHTHLKQVHLKGGMQRRLDLIEDRGEALQSNQKEDQNCQQFLGEEFEGQVLDLGESDSVRAKCTARGLGR